MRIRLNKDESSVQSYTVGLWDPDNEPENRTLGSYSTNGHLNWMGDISTPDFKRRQSKGDIINSPLYQVDFQFSELPHQLSSRWTNLEWNIGINHQSGVFVPPIVGEPRLPTPSSVDGYCAQFATEQEIAVTAAWANVDISEMQLLASLGEFPETVNWILSILRRGVSLLRALKRRKIPKNLLRGFNWKKGQKTASDAWLEFRYAFRPLVADLRNAIKALSAIVLKNSRMTARGWHHVEKEDFASGQITHGLGTVNLIGTVRRTSDYRAGVLYTIDSDINGLVSLWGLDQPLQTFWELTPFSFILDWFFSIGDTIASWSPHASLHPLSSWLTEMHYVTSDVDASDFVPNNVVIPGYTYVITSLESGYHRTALTIKRRTPCPSRAILPKVKINLDLGKILDLTLIGKTLLRSLR